MAELEKKIDALTASLQAQKGGVHDDGAAYVPSNRPPSEVSSYDQSPQSHYRADERLLGTSGHYKQSSPNAYIHHRPPSPEASVRKRRRIDDDTIMTGAGDAVLTSSSEQTPAQAMANFYNERRPLVFDHSDINKKIDDIIDNKTAERLFNRYVHHVSPSFPAVPIPPSTSAKTIRETKPILFLAIISSTSYGASLTPDLQHALNQELREVFADCMWKQGEKCLEIIQALQVASLWYRPPANWEQHNFYQMVHMSAIMSLDIGLGKRVNSKRKWFGKELPIQRMPSLNGAEARRAWLVCYFLCISITMILRRPILIRYNEYMRECMEYLETAPDALPSDKVLCQHIRLAHISEEVAVQFQMDDPSASISIADAKVTYGMKHFERDLAEQTAKNMQDPAIQQAGHVTNLYIHEIALHYNHNIEDFKAPFTEETFKSAASQAISGPTHVDALAACQAAIHDILDSFLACDFEVVYALPVIFCKFQHVFASIIPNHKLTFLAVRAVYAAVVLIKLYVAATAPGEMSSVIKKEDLHVHDYLTRLLSVFNGVVERDSQSPHAKFVLVVQRMNERYLKMMREENEAAQSEQAPRHVKAEVPQPAQGLHLLSEVAMGGAPNSGSHVASVQGPQGQSATAGWYPAVDMEAAAVDPMYQYGGQLAGLNNFDFTFGGMGLDDGGISGLFLGDGLWNFADPNAGLYPGWNA